MPTFSFTEKEWDKVRPTTLKKTGVSEAMRAVLKDVPKDLRSFAKAGECDGAAGLLAALQTAMEKSLAQIKPKEDKHDAAGQLKRWTAEVKDASKMVELQRGKLALAQAAKGAEDRMQELLAKINVALENSRKLAQDVERQIKAGQAVDLETHKKTQQDNRNVQRDAKKAITKRGFIEYVKFAPGVENSGVDPKDIPLPESVKVIKGKLDDLDEVASALSDLLADAVERQSQIAGDDQLAADARALIEEYKKSRATLKRQAAQGKAIETSAKKIADAIKETTGTDTSKLLAATHKLHQISHKYHDAVLAESYRSRNAEGDIQKEYSRLTKLPGFDAHNAAFRNWRAAIFDTVRTCTMPVAAVENQIDRVIAALQSFGGATADQAGRLAEEIQRDRKSLATKYGAGGGQ